VEGCRALGELRFNSEYADRLLTLWPFEYTVIPSTAGKVPFLSVSGILRSRGSACA
jgi:hypothetical protein